MLGVDYMNTNNTNNNPPTLQQKVSYIKSAFVAPKNKDLEVRELYIKSIKRDGVLIFIDGMVDSKILEKEVITPLIKEDVNTVNEEPLSVIKKRILTVKKIEDVSSINEVVDKIIIGTTILLIDGIKGALALSTTGFEHRTVDKPTNENVIKGPKEAFVESSKINLSLIRRQIKSEKLVAESIDLGSKQISTVRILYLDDVANSEIVEKVKSRLQNIKAEYVMNLSSLEQYIEDRPYSLIPTVLYTERPDRAASFLNEGHVVLIMDNSPSSLIVPITFWAFFHTAEDQYQRWFYGNFIRLIRFIAFCISFIGPGIYLAITNYHQEMLPTDLVLSIAGTRETMPFPAILEVLLMEISFELIREGSTRIPTTIGPTIGIVGALILGQAAVQANIVSPILVIVVAITGLSSFAIPEVSFSYTIRIGRFILLLCGIGFGFFGISLFISFVMIYAAGITSFDVPYVSPYAPYFPSSKDLLLRPALKKQWFRPLNMHPKDKLKKDRPKE
jgi:spore germination protein KA